MPDPNPVVPTQGFILGEKLYNRGKWIAQILIPALSTLYFMLGKIWNFPNVEQVIGSMAALDTFLGVLLGISTASYNASDAKYAGDFNVHNDEETGIQKVTLDLKKDPEELIKKDELTFKLNSTEDPPVDPKVAD